MVETDSRSISLGLLADEFANDEFLKKVADGIPSDADGAVFADDSAAVTVGRREGQGCEGAGREAAYEARIAELGLLVVASANRGRTQRPDRSWVPDQDPPASG